MGFINPWLCNIYQSLNIFSRKAQFSYLALSLPKLQLFNLYKMRINHPFCPTRPPYNGTRLVVDWDARVDAQISTFTFSTTVFQVDGAKNITTWEIFVNEWIKTDTIVLNLSQNIYDLGLESFIEWDKIYYSRNEGIVYNQLEH